MWSWFERRVDPFKTSAPIQPKGRFWPFMWQAAHGMRRWILAMALCTAFIGLFEAALFAMLGRLVDWLSQIPPSEFFARQGHILAVVFGLLLLSVVVTGLSSLFKHQVLAGNFPMALRWQFHRLLLSQSLGFYQDEFAGRLAAKVMQTALAVRDVWLTLAHIVVFITIYLATLMLVVGRLDWRLLTAFIAWLALYVLMTRWFVPRLAQVSQDQSDARALMTGRITDAYSNITTVKLFSHAGREAAYARESMQAFMLTVHRQMRMVTSFEVVNQLLSVLLLLATGGLSLWLWTRGEVTIGAVAATTAMALRLDGMAHWIMWELSSLFEQVGTVQDGMQTLSRLRQVQDKPDAQKLVVTQGQITFEQVQFGYDPQKPIFNSLSLDIKPGEKVGLIGRSGAGKSTLLQLLLRFFDVDGGKIEIDGQRVDTVTQESLRSHIAMVTQDTSLLHRSIAENIGYGRPEASQAEIEQAAKQALAHDFIMGLHDQQGLKGYEVQVGERGVKLSGGQRQRIAIARAILKDAPILLLDEATSALDSEVEAAIQDSLAELMEGKTVVAIAHRLSTIMAMDRLIVMDQGEIVEQGTHEQLLALGGLYAQLWQQQSGGFITS